VFFQNYEFLNVALAVKRLAVPALEGPLVISPLASGYCMAICSGWQIFNRLNHNLLFHSFSNRFLVYVSPWMESNLNK